jgi:hypothetical protein
LLGTALVRGDGLPQSQTRLSALSPYVVIL